MRTDINTILKDGANTKIKTIDYSTPFQQKRLKEVKERADIAMENKFISQYKLSKIIINR